jgi:lipopolysaccharide/colanic/teichoic acid biosynthesis glycosyltransferase
MIKNKSFVQYVSWVFVLVVLIISWQLTMIFILWHIPIRWWSFFLSICFIQILLAFCLYEGLRLIPLKIKIRYRWTFGLSALIGSLLWLWHPFALTNFLAVMTGTFLGCLFSTYYHLGLWEDNHPPAEDINNAVFLIHREVIGKSRQVTRPKRLFDILMSMTGLVLSAPVWFIGLFAIWIEDPGPLFFVKNSVGKDGRNFHQYKLRTMVRGAEVTTGPVMATEDDTRALRVGRLLRKSALDELPQLFNILKADMSFVGPRPQRTVLVYEYLKTMPEFAERHRVLPGLAGLAQVAGHYYITPRQKLRYDRIYTRHANLGFDLKLIGLALVLVFYLRWKPGGIDRIPRNWLH